MKKFALSSITILIVVVFYGYIKNSEVLRIEEIGFITHDFTESPMAAGQGKLILKDRCLYLERGNMLYLPLWPDRFELAIVDGELALLKEKAFFAKVGQLISYGGGHFKKRKYVEGIGLDYTNAKHCDFSHIIFMGNAFLEKD